MSIKEKFVKLLLDYNDLSARQISQVEYVFYAGYAAGHYETLGFFSDLPDHQKLMALDAVREIITEIDQFKERQKIPYKERHESH